MNVRFRYELNGPYAYRIEKELKTNRLYILRQ